MRINFGIFRHCKHQDIAKRETVAPASYTSVNLREEYANAFRTESYTDFWARVLDLTLSHKPRLLAEHLLDPDQPTATAALARARARPKTHALLTRFFSETANASLLCGLLLRDIDHLRSRYRPLRSGNLLADLNPFKASDRLKAVQAGSAALLERLESERRRARARLRAATRVRRGLAVALVALVASGAFVAVHGLVALAAVPAGVVFDTGRLGRAVERLDGAARGMYIVRRDMETISRLVERVREEAEHVEGMARFWEEKGRGMEEVGREVRRKEEGFRQKLDELEEHLFLCFMTINKARGIVLKQFLA